MKYQVVIEKNVYRQIERLPKRERPKIQQAILNLENNPRPHGCIKLRGRNGYRFRVGNYRIVYAIQDSKLIVYVLDVDDRKDIYR